MYGTRRLLSRPSPDDFRGCFKYYRNMLLLTMERASIRLDGNVIGLPTHLRPDECFNPPR